MQDNAGKFYVFNGKLIPSVNMDYDDIKNSPVYEVIRIIRGVPLFFEDHMERMAASLTALNINQTLATESIKSDIKKLLETESNDNCNVKIMVDIVDGIPTPITYISKSYYPPEEVIKEGVRTGLLKLERDNPNAKVFNSSYKKTVAEKIEIEATFVGSMEGLIALYKRQADIVGAHLWDEDTQDYNTPFIRYVLPEEEVVAVNLVQRQQGLLLQPGNPLNIKGIEDLNKEEVRFINRQKGSGTRLRLDSFLKKYDISSSAIEGYDEEENTHMGVACRISNGDANVGIAVQSVAQRLGLDFIPLFKERYDLICLKKTSQTKAWKNIIKLITTDHFQHAVQNHAGYDTSLTGTYIIGGD